GPGRSGEGRRAPRRGLLEVQQVESLLPRRRPRRRCRRRPLLRLLMRRLLAASLLVAGCGANPDSICDNTNNPCKTGFSCVQGLCQPATPAACDDGIKNGTETDVDCGGSCTPCGATQHCAAGGDCASTLCVNNRCDCPAGQHVSGTACATNTDTACGASAVDCTTAFSGGHGASNSSAGPCLRPSSGA